MTDKIASYDMSIALDTTHKKIYGTTVLTWKNISQSPIDELYLHMYYNAFKNSKSTFFKERGVPEFLTSDIDETCGWGWTHINSFTDSLGNELASQMTYVQPDDDNVHDQSVLKVTLEQAVLPLTTSTFVFNWEAKIPKTMPRTGYNRDFYFLAQWFPKLGVLEPAGMRFADSDKWNCHQYHSNGEYYSDFGDYNVEMKVPKGFVVASSGELVSKEEGDKQDTWKFFAHDVIDFTWSASPHFEIHTEKHNNTEIKFYCYPYKRCVRDRYLSTIKFAMSYLDENLMAYPYSTLSIIDPPIHGMFTGGMEYPTLITSLSFCFFPDGFRTPETLVVHEYIHQYFMQMVASHEVEETWMDEGITTYYEGKILDSLLGANVSTINFLGFRTGNKTFNRVEFFNMDNPSLASNDLKSWEYRHGGYGEIAYNKTALWLQTLEGLVGDEAMKQMMKQYFLENKFKHPSRYDFIRVVNEWTSQNMSSQYPDGMDWFFEQVLYGTGTCDYSVASISNRDVVSNGGFYDNLDSCETLEKLDSKYISKVVFHRLDELYFPVDILITFEDGHTEKHFWDGKSRSHEVSVTGNTKIVSAVIDPEFKIYIDKNFINNSLKLDSDTQSMNRIANNLFLKIQSLVEMISFLI